MKMEEPEQHSCIKINDPIYKKIHTWVCKNWQKPKSCENCGKQKRLDWANKSGNYLTNDRNDWLAICRSCHIRMDWTEERSVRMSRQVTVFTNTPQGRKMQSEKSKKQWTIERRMLQAKYAKMNFTK